MNIEGNQILYEDNHIIVVNKLPSEIVQGDKTGDEPLSEKVKRYLKEKYNKPGNVFLGVVHRLDRPVSGAIVFARTGKALSRLNNMLRERSIRKTYWAVVSGDPPRKADKLIHYLIKNQKRNMSFAFPEDGEGRQRAELDYKVMGKSDYYTLLEVFLHTGRHHQIRVQLSAIGCPVKGDLKYGSARSNGDGSIHLHSRTLAFVHPVKQEEILITADPPDDPLWNYFNISYAET